MAWQRVLLLNHEPQGEVYIGLFGLNPSEFIMYLLVFIAQCYKRNSQVALSFAIKSLLITGKFRTPYLFSCLIAINSGVFNFEHCRFELEAHNPRCAFVFSSISQLTQQIVESESVSRCYHLILPFLITFMMKWGRGGTWSFDWRDWQQLLKALHKKFSLFVLSSFAKYPPEVVKKKKKSTVRNVSVAVFMLMKAKLMAFCGRYHLPQNLGYLVDMTFSIGCRNNTTVRRMKKQRNKARH